MVETKPTVIVPIPTETTRVKWEFPEEEEKPRETVPKVKAQDWVPQNEVEHVVTKTTYNPSKIGRAWPPPGYEEKEEEGLGQAARTKATEDGAWIQQEFPSEQRVGISPWSQKLSGSGVRERQWPPTEDESEQREFSNSRNLVIQWPPPEFEEQKQQEIETIKNNLPVKANQRQWPPPPPQYVLANDENAPETQENNNVQQQEQTTTTTKTTTTSSTTTRRFGSQQQNTQQQEQQQPAQQQQQQIKRFGGQQQQPQQQQQQQQATPQTKQTGLGKTPGVQSTGGPVPKPTPQKPGTQPESPAPLSAQTSKLQVTKQQTKTIEKAQETAKIPQPVQPVQQQKFR
jgi:hypothetical protein